MKMKYFLLEFDYGSNSHAKEDLLAEYFSIKLFLTSSSVKYVFLENVQILLDILPIIFLVLKMSHVIL